MKKLYLFFLVTCCSLLSAPMALAGNMSGTYVTNVSGVVVIMQTVQSSGNQIQGRAEQVTISKDGQNLRISSFSISGAVSGGTIVLSLKDASVPNFLSGVTPMSGTLSGDYVQISGSNPGGSTFTWSLRRSSQADFNQQVAALSATANAESYRVTEEKRLNDQMKEKERKHQVEVETKKSFDDYCAHTISIESELKKIRGDFRKITVVMKQKLEKERATPPNSGKNGYERNQIYYSINGDWYGSNGVGYNLNGISIQENYKNETIGIESNLGDAMKENSLKGCGSRLTGFCAQVNGAFNSALKCNNDLIAAFQKTNAVKNQERAKQEAIKQEAKILASLSR